MLRNRKYFLYVLILFLVFSALGLVADDYYPYQNPRLGIALDYPEGWEVRTDTNSLGEFVLVTPADEDDNGFAVGINTRENLGGKDNRSILMDLLNMVDVHYSLDNFKPFSVTFLGNPALLFSGKSTSHYYEALVFEQDSRVYLVYQAWPQDSLGHQEKMDHIKTSLVITTPDPQAEDQPLSGAATGMSGLSLDRMGVYLEYPSAWGVKEDDEGNVLIGLNQELDFYFLLSEPPEAFLIVLRCIEKIGESALTLEAYMERLLREFPQIEQPKPIDFKGCKGYQFEYLGEHELLIDYRILDLPERFVIVFFCVKPPQHKAACQPIIDAVFESISFFEPQLGGASDFQDDESGAEDESRYQELSLPRRLGYGNSISE